MSAPESHPVGKAPFRTDHSLLRPRRPHSRRPTSDDRLADPQMSTPSPCDIKIEMVQPKIEDCGEDLNFDDSATDTLIHRGLDDVALQREDDSTSQLAFVLNEGNSDLNKAEQQGRYVCSTCNMCFFTEDALYAHVIRECQKDLQCTYCSFRTEFMNDMRSHLTLKHKDSTDPNFVYQKDLPIGALNRPMCTGCGKSFKNNDCLKKHVKYCEKSNEDIIKYKCAHCFYETKYKQTLRRHIGGNHPVGATDRPVCRQCGKSYKNEDCLKKHIKYCDKSNVDIVKHKCLLCFYETKWMHSLRRHIGENHPIGAIVRPVCSQCGKSYKSKSNLKLHAKYCEKSTNAMLKYKCSLCFHETKWKNSLRRHIRMMHPIEVIDRPTCTACGKSFKNNDCLKKHIKYCEKSNSDIVKHKCSICFYETKWKKHLKGHHRRVHPDGNTERQICFQCGRSYKNNDSLKKHIRNCKSNNITVKQE